MDFHSLLSIAQQKQKVAENKKQDLRGLNTKFSAPKKEQKPKERKSETVKKLIKEKELEKWKKAQAEIQRQKEEEKAKRFRIPKASSKGDSNGIHKDTSRSSSSAPLENVCEEEVVIHKEDFVKSSSKKRVAHNPAFNRPPVTPVKREEDSRRLSTDSSDKHHKQQDVPSSKRCKSTTDITLKSSSGKSDDRHSSRSSTSSSRSSNSSSKSSHSSKSGSQTSSSSKISSKSGAQINNGQNTSSLTGKALAKAANQHQVGKSNSEGKPKPKPRPMPPPMGFEDLLKLAEQKRKEPVKVEVLVKPVKKEEENMMTQEEKDRLSRINSKSYKDWLKYGKSNTSPEELAKLVHKHGKPAIDNNKLGKAGLSISTAMKNKSEMDKAKLKTEGIKRKLNMNNSQVDSNSKVSRLNDVHSKGLENSSSIKSKINLKEKFHNRTKSAGSGLGPPLPAVKPPGKDQPKSGKEKSALPRTKSDSTLQRPKVPSLPDRARPKAISSGGRKEPSTASRYSSTHENVLVCGPAKKEQPQNPFDRIYSQIQERRPVKRRITEEEEEDEDYSDEEDDFIDDDFIDDGKEDEDDYRKHLRDLFGYSYTDRFRNFDDRDDGMEASFAQQMKEEARSTRLGKLEDLEDIRREEEELRRKKLAKKKLKRR
ncbi:protein SPT2 homolog [Liolophura sinensis]|uniref:protein SPT2 homolog n=1 Tax=Liolophura sinensis TaxID=3198878 RepID=UPI003158DC9B